MVMSLWPRFYWPTLCVMRPNNNKYQLLQMDLLIGILHFLEHDLLHRHTVC